MIPYLEIPDLVLVPANALHSRWPATNISIHPFGALVALAIWVGIGLALNEAKRKRLALGAVQSYLIWILAGGFLGGHLFDWCFYSPHADLPSLFRLWDGQSSFGGFMGAGLGSWAWQRRWRVGVLPYAETIASSFPAAWFLGRLGCAVAHDHPGRLSSAVWAVAYPGGGRLDMGLMEAGATLPLAVAFLWLRRKPQPLGTFLGVMCVYYAPVRFGLDFARARDLASSDDRYLELTAAQWGCLGLLAIGVLVLAGARARAVRAEGGRSRSPVQKPI